MTAAGVENAAKKEVTRVGVAEVKQKDPSATATKDEMVMMAILNVILLMVLIGKANHPLQKVQEMKNMNQMLMAVNQNWQGMRTMHLKMMQVIPRMRIRAQLFNKFVRDTWSIDIC